MVAVPQAPDAAGRSSSRSRWLLLLCGLLLTSMLGCHSLGLFQRSQQAVKSEADPVTESAPTAPSKYSLRIAPCVFYSDVELKREEPVFQDLKTLPEQVYRELQLTAADSDATVQVYLFEDRSRYQNYMRVKHNLPERRAFFLKTERRWSGQQELLIYTFRGPKLRQDLRHELTHALVNNAAKQVPLWLDEGLAEYFELPRASKGLNASHVHQLKVELTRGMKFDLARLEALTEVSQMKDREYREAWAWVHLMLRGSPACKHVLLDYLHQLRDGKVAQLRPQLAAVCPNPEEALVQHIQALEADDEGPSDSTPPEERMHGLLAPRREPYP
jgi:hypothetical protein